MNNFEYRDREHWICCKTTEIVEVTECDPEEAREIAEEFYRTQRIPFGYTFFFKKYGYVKVANVLSNRQKFDRECLCDPMRIVHSSGRREAQLCWDDGCPRIYSYPNAKYYCFY